MEIPRRLDQPDIVADYELAKHQERCEKVEQEFYKWLDGVINQLAGRLRSNSLPINETFEIPAYVYEGVICRRKFVPGGFWRGIRDTFEELGYTVEIEQFMTREYECYATRVETVHVPHLRVVLT